MRKTQQAGTEGVARTARGVTPRQYEVLEFVAAGYRNKEIAHRLGISEATVKKHLESLRRRYKASNRVQLVRTAVEQGDISFAGHVRGCGV